MESIDFKIYPLVYELGEILLENKTIKKNDLILFMKSLGLDDSIVVGSYTEIFRMFNSNF